jgi:hypothetical protein
MAALEPRARGSANCIPDNDLRHLHRARSILCVCPQLATGLSMFVLGLAPTRTFADSISKPLMSLRQWVFWSKTEEPGP